MQDEYVRAAAFAWLAEQEARHGDVLPRWVLEAGFTLHGQRVPLMSPQGIFRPKVLRGAPLSITTSPNSPYRDEVGPDGLLRYRYRGTDPNHSDNQAMRHAMLHRLPLIYFHGIVPGKYIASCPVFIVADDPASLSVTVVVDDDRYLAADVRAQMAASAEVHRSDDLHRSYATAAFRVRLHQRAFRERVLEAYRRQCAFCKLRHEELLNAAHIIPDSQPGGEPHVRNGLALCTLHHSAFDRHFLGLRPDYTIEVRPDILAEEDGPTLSYAIQALHGRQIILPRAVLLRPDPELLSYRYEQFRASFGFPADKHSG